MGLKEGKPVAGMGNQPEDQWKMGIPSLRNSYVPVISADEIAAKAAELGRSSCRRWRYPR